MRGSVRLAALAGLHVIYVWTHDSVGPRRGRPDPPADRALRRAPGDAEPVVRAAGRRQRDDRRVAARGRAARRPRRAVPDAARSCRRSPGPPSCAREGVARGGYVLRRRTTVRTRARRPSCILIATGSELQLAFAAAEALEARVIRRARRLAPLLGAVRGAGRGVPRVGAPARRPAARDDRGGRDARLGALRRRRGRDHRHRPFRGVGAGRHDLREVRLHGRARRRTSRGASLREGLRGRIPTLDPGHQPAGLAARRVATPDARGGPVGRRSDVRLGSGAFADGVGARRVRGRPCGRGAQGASCSGASPSRARATSSSTSAGTAPIPTTTTRTSRSASANAVRDGRGRARHPHLRLRRRRERRRQQDPRRARRRLPRHVLGPPGRRARRHERADPRRAGHRARAGAGVRAGVPRRDASAASRATVAASTRSSRSSG